MARLVSWRSGAGGFTIVQDPEDALYAQMPASAMHFAHPDAVVPADDLAKTVWRRRKDWWMAPRRCR
jgi:chemotaxis response regulator CheB